MKDLIIDLHKQYSNRMLTVREATCLLVVNSYICSNNIRRLAIINIMLNEQQFILSMPNLMYEPMYEQWYDRANTVACGNSVDPKKLVELFKQHLPSAPADTPLLKYFGKSNRGRKPSTKLGIEKDIKPLFEPVAHFVYEHVNDKTDIEAFYEAIDRFDLLANFLWQCIPNEIKNEPSENTLSIADIKETYGLKDTSWVELFLEYTATVYTASKNNLKLECKDLASSIPGLSGNNTAQKDSTLFEALPSELKLRVMK